MPFVNKIGLHSTGYMDKPRKKRTEERFKHRRRVAPGFPWKGQFQTKEEVDEYFSGEGIVCLLCGRVFKKLGGNHIDMIHDMNEREYKILFGLPLGRGLLSSFSRRRYSDHTRRRIDSGEFKPDIWSTESEESKKNRRYGKHKYVAPYRTRMLIERNKKKMED